jgi:hypothetical protein
VAQLSRDQFDALEFGAARTGDHRDAALQMSQLLSGSTQAAGITRGEADLRVGEQWLLADDPAAAADWFRRALADGGETFVDARVDLARALFLLGDTDEARKLVERLDADGRGDPRKCDLVAELLLEQSDQIGALDWANTGVDLILAAAGPRGGFAPREWPPTVDRNELRMLLSLRYRIRNDMGLDEDEYDKLLDEL